MHHLRNCCKHTMEERSLCSECSESCLSMNTVESKCFAPQLAKATLQKYSSFHPGLLMAVLHRQDVFVRMATGSGKSLCMFLPPLCKSMGAIISPLNALMEQQVRAVK